MVWDISDVLKRRMGAKNIEIYIFYDSHNEIKRSED